MPARMPSRLRWTLAAAGTVIAALGVTACGSQPSTVNDQSADVENGARLFVERCSGCHTFNAVGAEGGATQVHDRERVDGPNFDVRREDRASVLYAIRNGGFSGAIMPENIVVGKEAEDVAAFVAKYAGRGQANAPPPASPSQADAPGNTGPSTTPAPQGETTPGDTSGTGQSSGGTEQESPGQGGGAADLAAQGKQVFTENCAGCHTLADAGSNGQVGPNLDDAQPDEAAVSSKVRAGGGGMPAFEGQLNDEEINAVAAYVSSVAGN